MTKQDYLEMLKNHDWSWGFGSTNTHNKGRWVENKINELAAGDESLAALLEAYQSYRRGECSQPAIKEEVKPVAQSHNKQAIMWDAWKIARKAARRLGSRAITFIAEAMVKHGRKRKPEQ
ncbi:MAG: hypothetical protein V3T17_02425 [Pseudomonadales bacterium]